MLLVALAAGVGLWQRRQAPLTPEDVRRLALDPSCDLRQGPCGLPLPSGGRVVLDITPHGIAPMAELRLDVSLEGDGSEDASWVDFAGVDMDMGFNRARLSREGEGRFRGSAMIPVCVRDRMLWEAVVLLSDGEGWLAAPFRFEVSRR